MNKSLLFIAFLLTVSLLKSQTPTASFANWKDNKKAAYTIIHDDFSAYVSGIYQNADPIATSRGIKFCFGAITHPDQCGPLEWAKAKTMISHGHECINHSHTHRCGGAASACTGQETYGTADFGTELGLSSQTIEAETGIKPLFFIHPYDASSTAIESYLANIGYLGARGGTQATYNASNFSDFMHLNFYVYAPGTAISTLDEAVSTTIAAGGYAIREFHGVADPSWGALTIAEYTNHLDYVKTQMDNGNLWSATASEVITYKMQRDAYQPSVVYNAATGQVDVNFTRVQNINTNVLKTPLTVNVNLNTTTNNYTASQNGLPVTFTRTGNTLSFNVYPHQGNVVLTCSGCNGGEIIVPDVTKLTAAPQMLSALVTWTNPLSTSFNDVLVVAKVGSGFTSKPVGTSYAANSDFAGDGATFEGGKVVYQGIGTNLNITNLAAGQTYFVRVFVRNGTDWSFGNEVMVTIPSVPTAVPDVTNLVANPQGISAMLSWINPTTTNKDVLVVVKAGSGFTTKPLDTMYITRTNFMSTSSAIFEGGKAVYQGSRSQITITNLVPDQTYYVRVFVRLGTQWSNGIETTLTIPPVQNVTNLVAVPQTNTVVTSWQNPNTLSNRFLVVVKAGSGFATKPTQPISAYSASSNFTGSGTVFEGGKVVYKSTGSAITIRNLPLGATYYIRVYTLLNTVWSNGVETTVTLPAANTLPSVVNTNVANSVQEQDKDVLQMNDAPEETPQYLTDKNNINSLIPYTFNIYPNPAKDRIAIDLAECEGEKVDIQILNFLGKELYREKIAIASPTHSMNINALEAGQYMLRIAVQGKKATVKKLIVAH